LLARRRAVLVRRFESCCFRFHSGVVEREDTRLLIARRWFDPCRRSSACPRGRTGDDAGLSTRKLRVQVPPGVSKDWVIDGWPKAVTEQRLRLCEAWAVTCIRRRQGGRAYLWRSTMVAGRRVDRQRMAPEGVERRFAPVEGSKTLLPTFSPGCRGDWPPRLLWAQETAGSTPASQICFIAAR
jgi:hypothetical protein